ncbi:hypothetical protein [Solibaculum mannosilyticum]|uniref:ABC transporter permease n=1 Tax=Solibaculum mannosilyticum TaxID=2780922 RepID=A0A7I8D673_9FIRM|nr:hypothetical protein [Solibaculum mannosilyticum]BCI61535.1 ABC transporter permease [Solibaculum mannosilyticum]
MLGKLMKYEFQASGRMMGLMVICALFITGVTSLSYALDIVWFQVTATTLLVLSMVAVIIFTYVVVAVRFFKSMYSREGYLTMTLPVSSTKLLGAKVIVSLIWLVLSIVVCVGMITLLLFLLYSGNTGSFFTEIANAFGTVDISIWAQYIAFFGGMLLMSMILFLSQVFFAITLANTAAFQRYSIVSAVFLYLGISVVMSSVEAVLTMFVPLGFQMTSQGIQLVGQNMMGMIGTSETASMSVTIGMAGTIFQFVEIVGLFFGTSQLIKRKLCIR